MNAHNYFSILMNGDEQVYFNTSLSPRDALKRNVPFAKYIVLGNGGGLNGNSLLGTLLSAAVTVKNYNANPANGMLRATYSADFSSSTPLEFSEIALCENADGSGACSYAVCEKTTVSAQAMEINSTIFAEYSGDVQLMGEDENDITLWMLGMGSIGSTYRVNTSDCYFPTYVNFKYQFKYITSTATPLNVHFTEDYLEFEGRPPNLQTGDLYIADEGTKVIARALIKYESKPWAKEINALAFGGDCNDFAIKEIFNVKYNGTPVTDFKVVYNYGKYVPIKFQQDFNFGAAADFRGQRDCNYVGVITNSEVYLLDCSDTACVIRLKVPYNNEDVEVCSNGSLILFGNTLKIYRVFDGEPTTYNEISLARGSKNVITCEGAAYHLARIFNGKIERYKIFGNSATLLSSINCGEGQRITRYEKHIAWFGTNGCPCGMASIMSDFSDRMQPVADYFASNPTAEIVSHNEMAISLLIGGVPKILSIPYGREMPIRNTSLSSTSLISRINNDSMVIYYPSLASRAFMGQSLPILNSFNIKAFVQTKKIFIALYEDGSIRTLSIMPRGATISLGRALSGGKISFNVISSPLKGSKFSNAKFRIYYPTD